MFRRLLVASLVFLPRLIYAQQSSGDKLPVQIIGAAFLTVTRSATGEDLNKLVGNVQLQQGDTYMACDSAYINLVTNNAEAFGHVQITQPGGTQVHSDYLRYTGNARVAFLQGNVSLTDGKNNLWSEWLTYNVGTKEATYDNGGTLQSDQTTLTSNRGMYNARTKNSRFTGDVMVNDPQYQTVSEDLGYNTETRIVTFFDASHVFNDKSELLTTAGYWDAERRIARFNVRSSLRNAEQYIEADTLHYDRTNGFGIAVGNVLALDTIQKTTLYSGYAAYNEITRKLWAARSPVLRHMNANDSLFLAADTFFSAHVRRPAPALPLANANDRIEANPTAGYTTESKARAVQPLDTVRRRLDTLAQVLPINDTAATDTAEVAARPAEAIIKLNPPDTLDLPDTTMPRYYTGYHHVRVFSDSLQAICDVIIYSGLDSVMRLIGAPAAWSRSAQITGDTILLYMEHRQLNRMYVPDDALIVSRSGPPRANLFDQVQGQTLTAHFDSNRINRVIVFPNAESIYFPTDEGGAYLGVNESKGDRMRVYFEDQKIRRILIDQDVKQVMTPMEQAKFEALRLSRFSWREAVRPKSRQELFYPQPLSSPAEPDSSIIDSDPPATSESE